MDTPDLPSLPLSLANRYHRLLFPAWTGWIDRDLHSAFSRPLIERPRELLEGGAVRWLKSGRNRLAEVRWPGAGSGAGIPPVGHGQEASGTGVAPASHGHDAHATPATVVLKEFGAAGLAGHLRDLIRPPRAVRAWERAFALIERGFNTPRPLYLMLPRNRPVSAPSYLAVESAPPHVRLREILRQIRKGEDCALLGDGYRLATDTFLAVLARYVRAMHDAGIWHRDFSGGNLLVPNTWRASESTEEDVRRARREFVLIDVNRSRLRSPDSGLSVRRRMHDLERISLPPSRREAFYAAYATGRPDLERAKDLYLRRARLYRRLRETHNPLLRLYRKVFTYWVRFP